jgi:hypothetical protein
MASGDIKKAVIAPKSRQWGFFNFLWLLSVPLLIVVACQDDYSGSGQARLVCSVDTVSFDTLFSTIGSTTAWVRLYNPGKEKLTIQRVTLASGGQSGFRINLDGEENTVFEHVTIPPGDSLFLFVALTAPVNHVDTPVYRYDAVLFQWEGGSRQLVLEAWSWDAAIWHGKTIASDTTLTAEKPIVLYDSLVVKENVTLTIKPGTAIYLHDQGKIIVYGTIKAHGTFEKPILFRGDRLDKVLPDFPYDYYPGQWHYIQLKSGSFENELDHVQLRGSYYGIVADSASSDRIKCTITNSIIHNTVNSCLFSLGNRMLVANTQLSNSGGYTVCLIGGKVEFIHCTIANYQQLVTRNGPAVVLANYLIGSTGTDTIGYPLQFTGINCLVAGSNTEELGFALTSTFPREITFSHSLLQTGYNLGTAAVQCQFTRDPHFLKLGRQEEQYVYDFRIDSVSPARQLADPQEAAKYPLDLSGKTRWTDEGPDAGAYEYHP